MKIFGYNISKVDKSTLVEKTIEIEGKKKPVTPGPSSKRDTDTESLPYLQRSLKILKPGFEFDVIPLIRKLEMVNPDMSQAYNDLVQLANTGHKVKFDPSVPPDQVDSMRKFIKDSAKHWVVGAAGVDGVVSKMFRQLMIGGAIANEWVPNFQLDDLEELRILYPERIRYIVPRGSRAYQPYQLVKHKSLMNFNMKDLKKLNVNQFRYYALNGDTEVPYGTPPYLPALTPIATQKKMLDNIDFVIESLGILGYLDAKMDKPDMLEGESDSAYVQRMTELLNTFKERVQEGFRDGINVGFEGEHEFDFSQTVKTAQGASELFEQNELQIASALKYDQAFMGRSATETMVTILFTKMLSQLSNIQNIVKENLEFGYKMVLQLGGFNFKELSVEFNKSTITDTLKYQQAREILIRNLNQLYADGIIGQDQYADEAGYIKPDQPEPRVDPNAQNIQQEAKIKQDGEKKKDASDRKGRDKKNPQGTVRRQNNSLSVVS